MNAALSVLADTWPLFIFAFGLLGILCAADRHDTKRNGDDQ